MANNIQRITAIEKGLGELDGIKFKVRDLTDVRDGFDAAGLQQKIEALERDVEHMLNRINNLEQKGGSPSLSNPPLGDECIENLEMSVNNLQGTINEIVENCQGTIGVLRHEIEEIKYQAQPHHPSCGESACGRSNGNGLYES
ncbi:hypothetical protein PanWU01x14_168290 [Parasponia andersonii]|uniref:Uncharacterized protein n=1 Tax=Parasponia andersonii TaxID=3476 RepID=A0A2P5CAZ2_PARAD|nr:hypothetical protein PanWU01x14_168290 [Parasponia andersonii]